MSALKNIVCVAAVVATVVLLGVASASATPIQLLQNGGFEYGTTIGSSHYLAAADGAGSATSDINWWTLASTVGTFNFYMDSGFAPPEEGSRLINLAPNNTLPVISQSFPVLSGVTYSLSFWEKYRSPDNYQGISATLTATSANLTSLANNFASYSGSGTSVLNGLTNHDSGWTNYTLTFTASAADTVTLAFRAQVDDSGFGVFLDNASVTYDSSQVPEPGTLTLLAMGLAGLLCYPWRRRR